ncbi:hypothetical protein AwDysgo_15880 [Bacteroidales bacterium]|nr:hypothetical protein AwDysgo_15880 [Bacteroidales bacterium]
MVKQDGVREAANTQKQKGVSKLLKVITLLIILGVAGFVYGRYFFVFGEGVKTGQLNYVVLKGYAFKTYEGKLIQAGFRSPKTGVSSGIQSYEFEFSISDPKVADRLMLAGGKEVELHYREYKAAIPWRGYSTFIVDSIVAIK